MSMFLRICFLALLSVSNLTAEPTLPATSGKVQSGAIINGQMRSIIYDWKQNSRDLFTPKDFALLHATIIDVLAPNRILVETQDQMRHEFILIGLMDFSLGIHQSLRDRVIATMKERLLHQPGLLFIPKNPRKHGLLEDHVFLNVNRRMVNLDLLSEGYGILPEGQIFFPEFLSMMDLSMQEAAKRGLGIWGQPTTSVREEDLSRHGIDVNASN